VITEVRKITSPSQVNFQPVRENIETLGEEFDEIYLEALKSLSLSPEAIARNKDLKIVFTPIHGTGVELVPKALRKYGFTNLFNVPEQDITDGNFPTVVSPNPENAEALKMAMDKAEEIGADLVMATDPDADRVGIAVRDNFGKLILLNGNQTAALLVYYLIRRWKETGKIKGKEYIVKTIVTTDLLSDIASHFGVESYEVLTGFKYIAEIIKENEGKKKFIVGGEESYGYLAGEFIRDKDAIMSCALIAETAAWAKDMGKSLYDLLIDIYIEFGLYKEKLLNLEKHGKEGAEAIIQIMNNLRENPPAEINNSPLIIFKDYKKRVSLNMENKNSEHIDLPVSDVLQFVLKDGTKISVRPSGTEPKIKFYVSANGKLLSAVEFEQMNKELDNKLEKILKFFNK
jgi:phosphoglucomutase